jgi:hemolysin activation/secretion protein
LALPAEAVPVSAIPDAGSILRDQKVGEEQPQRQFPSSEEKKAAPAKAADGVRVDVKGFTFSGYEGVATEAELKAIVASATGKTLSYGELQYLVDAMTASFKEKGFYQAKAILPQQDITSGIIHIAVKQVRSDGRIGIKRDKSARIDEKALLMIVQPVVHDGQPVNEHELERAMLLMNDLPGIVAKASFVPGTKPGTTGVEIAVSERPLVSGGFWGDNNGNIYTGVWRGNAMLSLNGPLQQGDQITLMLTKSSGLFQGRAGFSTPLHSSGLRASLAYTGMRYELGGDLASLGYKGKSSSIDAGLSYPLLRSRTSSMTTTLFYGYRNLSDSQSDIDIRNKRLHNATFSVSGDRYDRFYGGGYTTYSLGVTTGTHHESIADISLTGTEGNYTHFNFGLARLQRFSESLNINVSGTAQMATGNLNSSEKMTLGGPSGVRAYPGGEASGDEGQLFSADMRYTLPVAAKLGNFQLSVFYDAGHITLNHTRFSGDVSNATNRNDFWLQGAGIGLNCSFAGGHSLRASWAHVIGDNPGRSESGTNSDGFSDSNRFWLQAMISY